MKLAIYEVLERASKAATKEERIEILRSNNSKPLQTVLKYAFDPSIKWLLPKGKVPYKPYEGIGAEGMLHAEARRLYLFVEGGNPNLKQNKREMLFIGLLEALHPKDAEIIAAAKDKKIPYKFITANLVNEAFPELIPNVEDKEEVKA